MLRQIARLEAANNSLREQIGRLIGENDRLIEDLERERSGIPQDVMMSTTWFPNDRNSNSPRSHTFGPG
jgi:hypothetical protein